MIGKQLAHYEIVSQLGKGGMGEVYHARDTKLGRDVALKLLPDEVTNDLERVARFRREAKVLASLNHPGIASLFDLEEADGRVFLIMELAEGEDMSERLARGAISVDQALPMALQISEALEAAHEKGIVHRDLKPANVMLLQTGRTKLLDFGLARAYQNEDASGDPMMSPTITAAMTQAGVILGTAAYMSPEQARGKSVDRQSDVWAFGVLLFEMLTGHRLFEGETISDSIGAILHREPDWNLLPANTPPQVHQLLRRCLARELDQRLKDIGDARVAISDAMSDPSGASFGLAAPAAGATGRGWLVAVVVALVGLAAGYFIGGGTQSESTPPPYRVLDLGVELAPGDRQSDGVTAAIAPDGHAVAYAHDGMIEVQDLAELKPRKLAGSEDAFAPFWSPDSTQLGWFQNGRLWKVTAQGGQPVALCEISNQIAGGVGASWGDDGRILFTTGSSAVMSVPELGGQTRVSFALPEGVQDIHEPFVLPGGAGTLVVLHGSGEAPARLALVRGTQSTLLFHPETGGRIAGPHYDPAGYILFRLQGGDLIDGLWAIGFDLDAGTVRGEPVLVQPDASEAVVANDGTMVFVTNPSRSNSKVISRISADGARREEIISAHGGDVNFRLSPDGNRIAFTAEPFDGGTQEIWVHDLRRGSEARVSSTGMKAILPAWAPDGASVAFSVLDIDSSAVRTMRVSADGSRAASDLIDGMIADFLPDGRSALVIVGKGSDKLHFANNQNTECWQVSLEDPTERRFLFGGSGRNFPLSLSPDGQYLLYVSSESGTFSAYLTRYPECDSRWKVSLSAEIGGAGFSPDGRSIFYSSDEVMYEVPLSPGPTPELGRPERVFDLPPGVTDFLVDPTGNGFLVAHPVTSSESSDQQRRVKVVQGWAQKIAGR